ncbi:MAG: flavodoxin [Ruminococcaceae bacterium]|nr:flavodoxin [Oscillospiraceae bacterium]
MKVAVRYYSVTGHTKKIADAIAGVFGVEALTVDVPLEEDVDILFLGSAVYAANLDAAVKDFINGISVNVGKIVNFSSAAILKGTHKQVKDVAEARGLTVDDNNFFCKGAFKFIAKGRPNDGDVAAAVDFAKQFLEK